MSQKNRLKMISLIIAGIFLCVVFAGVVEGAEVIERNDVRVGYTETEIIEPTYTDKNYNRIFDIDNGEYEIMYSIWGSNDNHNWEFWESGTIPPNGGTIHVLGKDHFWYVKLTGRTTGLPTQTSMVDASLHYHIP